MRFKAKILIITLSFLAVGLIFSYLKQLKPTYTSYTIKQLYETLPLEENVEVKGKVTRILKDYRSKRGNVYQRFFISSENRSILCFCLIDKNRLRIVVGDKVRVRGVFIKYKNFYEILCRTSNVEII